MPDLSFHIDGAEPERQAAVPTLSFKLRVIQAISENSFAPIRSAIVRCQIRIEPARRRYSPSEQKRLVDLFDRPERWGLTLRPMLWTHATINLPPFEETASVDLAIPCSFDFCIAATKYFDALENGEIPLCFLFSGTIFYEAEGALRIAQVPWEKEAYFRLPAATWRKLAETYYPNTAWLGLRKDSYEKLAQFKNRRGFATFDQAIDELLSAAEEVAAP
jgi:hypothetical protein